MKLIKLAEAASSIFCHEEWFEDFNKRRYRHRYLQLLSSTKSHALIITGELDPAFYNHRSFVFTLVEQAHRGVTFEIIFYKDASSPDDALSKLYDQNPDLMDSLTSLPNDTQRNVQFLWAPARPKPHFSVFDGEAIYLEFPHTPQGPRKVLVSYNPALCRLYMQDYQNLKDRLSLLPYWSQTPTAV